MRPSNPKARFDSAYLDNQYNNRLRVPDFIERHMQPWQRQSAQVRGQGTGKLDIAYASGGPSQTLDIFPASGKAQPVLVFVHGGYWRSLDKADFSFVAPAFNQLGACVVVPNYSLCPAVTMPELVLEQVQALAWVYRHIAQYGGDPARITVVGHSAGGHLAAMLLACEWQRFDPSLPKRLVRNAMGVSGLYDLEPLRHSPYLQTDLRLSQQDAKRCSPAHFKAPQGPFYAVCGADESDEFLRQNRLIESAWGHDAVPVHQALAGLNHFSVLDALCQPAHRASTLVGTLLR